MGRGMVTRGVPLSRRLSAIFPPALMIFIACAMLLPYTDRVMYCDEANTLYQYASSPVRALFSYATPNNHLLHSLQVWAMTTLAGTSGAVVRFPAFAAALAALALAYRTSARLVTGDALGRRNAGMLSMAFLLTAFGFADYAINARGYTLSIALTLALIDLVFATPPGRFYRRRHQYSLILVSAALILTLPSMILASGAVGLWALIQQRRDRRWRRIAAALIVGGLIGALPYLPSVFAGLMSAHLGMFGEFDLIYLLEGWMQMVFSTGNTPVLGALFAAATLYGGVLSARSPKPTALPAALLLGIASAAVLGQFVLTGHALFARNYLYLIAPLALLAGAGGARLLRGFSPAAVLLLTAAGAFSLPALDGVYMEKAIIGQIDQHVGDTDWLIVGPCLNAPALHHLTQTGRADLLFERPGISRVIVVTREGSIEDNLAYFDAADRVRACQPFSDIAWASVNAFVCQPATS
ncbi:MAG: hypothetical protein JNL42_13455 [Anaerolineae bacterium]|nr:hypothetical protein [Anaerolineae bacterium]